MGLTVDRIDHLIVAVPDAQPGYEAFSRLGIPMTEPHDAGDGNSNTTFSVGAGDNAVVVELSAGATARDLIGVPVDDLAPWRDAFADAGGFHEFAMPWPGGEMRTLRPKDTKAAGARFLVLQYPTPREGLASTAELPLLRVDHLAIIPPDLDSATRFWVDVLGVPLQGELTSAGFEIRQLAVGDLMIELLRPRPDGSSAGAAPGIVPMIACEVADLDAGIDHARSRGFTLPDASPGALPGTIRATIDADQLGGLALQLLRYI